MVINESPIMMLKIMKPSLSTKIIIPPSSSGEMPNSAAISSDIVAVNRVLSPNELSRRANCTQTDAVSMPCQEGMASKNVRLLKYLGSTHRNDTHKK